MEPTYIHQTTRAGNGSRTGEYNYTDVLVIYNENSALSIQIALYFQNARNIPNINMCNISTSTTETVSRTEFDNIRGQIESYLDNNNLTYKINYLVTTKGVPLRVSGGTNDRACLDSELTMIKGQYQSNIGNSLWYINPYFELDEPFSKAKHDLYLVTRFTGFTWPEIKGLIDNATVSSGQRGTYVLDVDASKGFGSGGYGIGNVWIRNANQILTQKGEQTYYDETNTFITDQTNVFGYASWGSNDAHDKSNYVSNYGFESSTNNFPNNWYGIYDPKITDNISVNSSDSSSGSYSVQINRTTQSGNCTAVAQNITIMPNIRYYLYGRVNISSITGPGGAHLQVQALDASDNILKIQNTNFRTSVTSSWVSFSQKIYEPVSGAVKVRILAILNQSSGVVFFDYITFNDILPHNTWLPGAIAETFVSTGGRSFTYGTSYGQSLVADLIRDGVTGVKGYVYEPYLSAIAHPDILFDRYTDGYNLAESYYMASNFLGWMDVVVGDPKMAPYSELLPDLTIPAEDLSYSPKQVNEDEELSIKFNVTNIGNRTVENSNIKLFLKTPTKTIFINESIIQNLSVQSIIKKEIKFIVNITGDAELVVVLDPENQVKELEEYNNMAKNKIHFNRAPSIDEFYILTERINRTEEIKFDTKGSDLETADHKLIPFLDARHESDIDWFRFEEPQIQYQYASATGNWEIEILSNFSMGLGKYSFRLIFMDENNARSNYYLLDRALEVVNNPPIMDEIMINRTVINRAESVKITSECSDIENTSNELTVELQYRIKPEVIESPSGWKSLDMVSFNDDDEDWWGSIEFESDSKIGDYQIRGRVIDFDQNTSQWKFAEQELTVMNNLPIITNFKVQEQVVYRTQAIELYVIGFDVEDDDKIASGTCEIEYSIQTETRTDEIVWETEYLDEIKFDYEQSSWRTEFKPPAEAQVGSYSLRTRIRDQDANWSLWEYSTQLVLVLNNPPEALQSTLPGSVIEDEKITFNAKKSIDIEDGKSNLIYYWVLSTGASIKIMNSNKTFTVSLPEQGEYQVCLQVMDSDGTSTWENSTISVKNIVPSAMIEINRKNIKVDEIIMFSAEGSSDTSSDLGTLTYFWDFGDDTTGSGMIVNHSYGKQGRYITKLTVKDDDFAMDNITVEVIIYPAPAISEPEETNDNYQMYSLIIGTAVVIFVIIALLIIFIKRKRVTKSKPRSFSTTAPAYAPPTAAEIKPGRYEMGPGTGSTLAMPGYVLAEESEPRQEIETSPIIDTDQDRSLPPQSGTIINSELSAPIETLPHQETPILEDNLPQTKELLPTTPFEKPLLPPSEINTPEEEPQQLAKREEQKIITNDATTEENPDDEENINDQDNQKSKEKNT